MDTDTIRQIAEAVLTVGAAIAAWIKSRRTGRRSEDDLRSALTEARAWMLSRPDELERLMDGRDVPPGVMRLIRDEVTVDHHLRARIDRALESRELRGGDS